MATDKFNPNVPAMPTSPAPDMRPRPIDAPTKGPRPFDPISLPPTRAPFQQPPPAPPPARRSTGDDR